MKKEILATAAITLAIVALSSIAIPAFAASSNPNQLYGAPDYVLNIIGKKDNWSGGGTYDNVQGWICNATDNTYLLQVGSVTVKGHNGKPQWTNATDLFWVSSGTDPFGLVPTGTSMWVFDYINALQNSSTGTYMYLWSLMTNNDKLLQVRFYQIG